MTRTHRTGLAWATAVLAAAVLLLAAPAQDKKAALPADLDLVPRDAAGFLSVRVADLWADAHFQKMRAELTKQYGESVKDLEKSYALGVDLGQVERLTVVMPKLPEPRSEGLVLVLLVTTAKPYDKAKVLGAVLPESKEQAYKGKTLHVAGDAAVYPVNERSYAMGPTPAVEALLDQAGKGAQGPLSDALARAAGTHQVTAGLNMEPVRGLLAQARGQEAELFKPLVQAKSAAVSFDVGKGTTFEGRLKYATAAEADEGAAGAKALVSLIAGLALPQLEQALEKGQIKGDNLKKVVKEFGQILKTPPVAAKEEAVHVDISLKADIATVAGAFQEVFTQARGAASTERASNNLKQIALAMHNYHDTHGHFPPAAICDKDGKPLLSWRVAILPYIEQDNVYKEFRLDEPWDSEHNKPLSATLIPVFASPGLGEGTKTHYRAFVGGGAVFETKKGTMIADITDGTSNTFLVVEATEAVEWAKPDDLPYDPKKELPKLGLPGAKDFQAAFADGSVRILPKDTDKKRLHALITRAGGEVIE